MRTKLFIAIFIGFGSLATKAQVGITPVIQSEPTKPAITPEKAASNQANKATKTLGLNDEQKKQFEAFSLTRITAVWPLKEKLKTSEDKEERKTIQKEIHAQMQAFNTNVTQILTTEQKTKWEVGCQQF